MPESDEAINAFSALSDNEILQKLDKLGVQRAMIDTGAGKSLGPVQDNTLLSNKVPSQITIKVAVTCIESARARPFVITRGLKRRCNILV